MHCRLRESIIGKLKKSNKRIEITLEDKMMRELYQFLINIKLIVSQKAHNSDRVHNLSKRNAIFMNKKGIIYHNSSAKRHIMKKNQRIYHFEKIFHIHKPKKLSNNLVLHRFPNFNNIAPLIDTHKKFLPPK